MALSVKIFNGKLNKDTHPYRIPQGDYIDALNITRDAEGDGQDEVVSNINGNKLVQSAPSSGVLVGVLGNMAYSARPFSNPDVQNAIASLGQINIIRYPGGSVANTFNWETGKDDDGSGNASTLQDVASLYHNSPYDILFVLNMCTKTLDNQLAMLATAASLGIIIKYVELGNEINVMGSIGHTVYPTPEDYADTIAIWMPAIRAIYPDVLITAVGGSFGWCPTWNDVILATNPDALSWHLKTFISNFYIDGEIDYAAIDTDINDDWLESGFDTVTTVPIWATEFNYHYEDDNVLPENIAQAVTLYMMQQIPLYIEANAGIKMMCVRTLESSKEGALIITGSTITIHATGYALRQYSTSSSPSPQLGISKVIGGKEDLIRNRYYIFTWNSNGNHLITYYDGNLNLIVKVLESKTDSGGVDVLEFDPSEKIHSVNILNTNDGDLLSFIDSLKRPSKFNVGKALSGFYGVWQRSFLDAAKEPPSLPPKCIFEDDVTVTVNNFKKRLFKFRHRFVFENNEKSVYSPESEIPLPYDIGNPDFDTDPTHNARISIILETGALNVKKIELVGAVSIGNTFSDYFLIYVFDKEELGLSDNNTTIYKFFNDKQYPTVDINEIIQPYDYVPKKANTQGMANGNTIEYAGITEGYDRISINADVDTALDDDAVFQYPKSILYGSQTDQGIKIIVIGTIQEDDTFNIYTTNEAFQYVANAGDVTSDVIFGLRDAAVALGFTVVLTNADTWIILTKAGETFELYLEIPATPTDFTDVTPAYDWLSKNSFGLVYFDEKGREMGGVLTSDALTASMPINNVSNELPYVDLTINHRPPIDAKTFQVVRSKDIAKLSILQWVTDRAFKDDKYAYISIASLNQFIVDNPGTGMQLGYSFTPGDRIRFMQFIWDGVPQSNYGTVLDFEILASVQNPIINGLQQTGQILKIALPTGSLSNFFNFGNIEITAGVFKDFENYFVEIYTPSKPIGDNLNVYYEFGEKYDILDAGTEDRRHQGMLINQSADLIIPAYFRFKKGDYYYRIRDINVGNELKYTLVQGDVNGTAFVLPNRHVLGLSLSSSTYNADGYTAKSSSIEFIGGNTVSDSGNWFIDETDGLARIFHIKGQIILQATNSTAFPIELSINATSGGTESPTILYTSPSPINTDDILTAEIDSDFTIPAGYNKTYLLYDGGNDTFDAKIIGGNLIVTENDKVFTVNVIDKNFSDYFLSSVNSNGRSWAIEPNAKEEYNPVKIRFSQEFDQDTNTNGLNRFYEDNFVEIDRSAADIQRLFVDGRQLYAFQKFNVGVIPILMQIVKDVSGNPLEANSDLLLNKVAYPFTGKYGIGDAPCSLSYGKGKFFFVDTNKKIVCGFVRGGDIEPLSVIYDINSFLFQNLAAYRKDLNNGYPASGEPYTGDADIYGIFNRYTNKYILALEEINRYDVDGALIFHQDPKTISFSIPENGQAKGFESLYSYHPEWLGNLGTLLISLKDGITWTHNNSIYCNFYGTQYECYIVAVFNDHGIEKKSWIGLTETANEIWDCPEITTQVNTYASTPQSSRLPAARFTLQEGEFAASLLRDVNSYGGLINGSFLKGNYMIVKFQITSASIFVFLNAVGVKYNVSKLVAV